MTIYSPHKWVTQNEIEYCEICGIEIETWWRETETAPTIEWDCRSVIWREAIREATEIGAERGKATASWVFDGNTDIRTYAHVLRGLEGGDPAVLDSLPFPSLSGEFADDFNSNDLYKEVGISPEDDDSGEICRAWEDASSEAFLSEIERLARFQTAPDTTCGHCGHEWNSLLAPTPSARCPNEYDHEYPDDESE